MSVDGVDLGPLRATVPNWAEGDRIHRGGGDDLVVVRLVASEDGDDVDGYLVVQPLSERRGTGAGVAREESGRLGDAVGS
jgi:hypothetical protein